MWAKKSGAPASSRAGTSLSMTYEKSGATASSREGISHCKPFGKLDSFPPLNPLPAKPCPRGRGGASCSALSASRQILPERTRAHRRRDAACIRARSAFFFFFLAPVCAAPRPVFRLLAELGLDGIVFDVAQRFIKMLPVTNVPIKRIALPESSGPSQRPIALFCRKRSPRTCDLAPSPSWARREQCMYVVGHHAPGVQVVTFSGEV